MHNVNYLTNAEKTGIDKKLLSKRMYTLEISMEFRRYHQTIKRAVENI